jgi:predicted membrane protein
MTTASTTTSNAIRITPRLIVGFGILSLGILWTLDNLDFLESERITEWWPLILIVIGVVRFFDRASSRSVSVVLMIVGLFLLLDSIDLIDWDLGDFIPLGIALLGAKLIWDAVSRRQAAASNSDPNANIHAFAIMAGISRQSTSPVFRGGDANAIMGGVELDLRNAQIAPGEIAVLDVFAMWGGVEITVPDNWTVVGEVLPLMGGFEDKTISKSASNPTLLVRGAAVMGAVEVKNAPRPS